MKNIYIQMQRTSDIAKLTDKESSGDRHNGYDIHGMHMLTHVHGG